MENKTQNKDKKVCMAGGCSSGNYKKSDSSTGYVYQSCGHDHKKGEACSSAGLEEIMERAISPKNKETTYRCPECGFCYRDKETAARCEAWCKKHKSCNLDITKNAINE